MCNPAILAVGSLVMGVAQSGLGFMQQQQQYEQQQAYYEMNKAAANKALVNSYAGDQNQEIQQRNAADQKAQQGNLAAVQARATAVTAAGQAGVGGMSVDALLGDYYSRESMNRDAIDANYKMQAGAIEADELSQQGTAVSRINSVQQGTPPSFADAAIRMAGAAFGAAGQYYSMTTAAKPWAQPSGLSIPYA